MRLACARVSALHRDRRQFRGSMGSDGFEKVFIGTRGAREAFLDGLKGRAAKNSVLTSGAKNSLNASGAKLTRACMPRTVKRQFRGNVGSDGFEKVLIGTRGAREAFLDGAKGRAAKNSVLTSGAKQLKC